MHPIMRLIATVVLACSALTTVAAARAAPAEQKKKKNKKKKDPNRYEWGLLPELSYSSDWGFGFGFIGSLAKYKPGYYPYHWRLRVVVSMTVKQIPDSKRAELPLHTHKVSIDLPGLWKRRLRLSLSAAFRRTMTAGYYGIGNNTTNDTDRTAVWGRYHQYRRTNPGLGVSARLRLRKLGKVRFDLFAKLEFAYNVIRFWRPETPEEAVLGDRSQLEEDLAGASGDYVRRQLTGTGNHGYLGFTVGLVWDSRNHETAPSSGMLHDISGRCGGGLDEPFGFGGATAAARFYTSLYKEYLVLAARFVVDLLVGRPPIYELTSHGGLGAGATLGGGSSIRGVPGHRFGGKIKMLGTVELRSKLLPFRISKHHFNLGAVVFTDVGRAWADYKVRRDLDGVDRAGFGLKAGVGGGLRLQWGESFLIRADLAWSHVDDNLGIYIDASHVF